MNIVLTGSIGNIGKPLTKTLVSKGHQITVISSNENKRKAIEDIGAKVAIGSIMDGDFISATFKNADIVYLMGIFEAIGDVRDNTVDFEAGIKQIGHNYANAILDKDIKKVVHLSSVGAHTQDGNGILRVHFFVEQILKELPKDVSIKCLRPVGFFSNLYRSIQTIKAKNAIIQNFGGDEKEPWVSPYDIADAIVEEMETPFDGRKIRYVASDEVSPNEIASVIGEAIGNSDLKWMQVSDEQMLDGILSFGMNKQLATGFVEMQASQRNGILYEDYYKNPPVLGKIKLEEFAKEFATTF